MTVTRTMPSSWFTQKRIARFWSRVNKNGPIIRAELGPCWVWPPTKHDKYGRFDNRLAHRVSYVMATGCDTDLLVLHKCDNPACVNPDHLFAGTPLDNTLDRKAKGRKGGSGPHTPSPRRGEKSNWAKLTEESVREMRLLYKQGVKTKYLAARFEIGATGVFNVVSRKTWKHIL